jgi:hypothetical protein
VKEYPGEVRRDSRGYCGGRDDVMSNGNEYSTGGNCGSLGSGGVGCEDFVVAKVFFEV